MKRDCPVCGSEAGDAFVRIEASPALCHRMCRSRHEALAQPTGPIELALCPHCGLVYNRAFDAGLIRYDGQYENALHFSDVFRDYERLLVNRLVARHEVRGRTIVEIGCGDGHFLAALCRASASGGGVRGRGLGFDPAFDPRRHQPPTDVDMRIETAPFDPDLLRGLDVGLICCRQVLEHIEAPAAFVGRLRRALERPGTPVFFEVPSAMHSLARRGFWDVIYEHIAYYTPAALRVLFERAGFEVAEVAETYSGQFLTVDARAAGHAHGNGAERKDVAELAGLTTVFRNQFESLRATWRRWLDDRLEERRRVVIWGAGSKTVTFLNHLNIGADQIACVVDRNPRKRGCYIVGTGQRIIAPPDLAEVSPDEVLALNPAYRGEISGELEALGCRARLTVVE